MKIFKYPIDIDTKELELPWNSKILTVQVQAGFPCIWAMVNEVNGKEKRKIKIVATGEEFDDHGLHYIGTFQLAGGALIFHLFEEKE